MPRARIQPIRPPRYGASVVAALAAVFVALAPKVAEAQAVCEPLGGLGPVRINEPYSCGAFSSCPTPPGFDFANLVGCETTVAPPGMGPDGIGIAPLQPASYPFAAICTCQAIRISDGAVLEFTESPSTVLVVNDNVPPVFDRAIASVAPPPGAASPVIRQIPVATTGSSIGVEVRSGESLSLSLDFFDPDGDPPQIELVTTAPISSIDTQLTWVADHAFGPAVNAVVWPVAYPGDRRGQPLPITIFVGNPYPTLLGLEVSQGIQSWRNHVPLIADRTTWVRAAVRSDPGATTSEKAKTVLVGFDQNGVPLLPVLDSNDRRAVTIPPGGQAIDRADVEAMPLFELPPEWMKPPGQGGVRRLLFLRIEEGDPLLCSEPTNHPFTDPANDCVFEIEIGPANPLDVQVVELDVTLTTSALTVTSLPRDTARRVRARLLDALPVSSVTSHGVVRRIPFVATDGPDALTRRVLQRLRKIRRGDECRAGCDRVYVGSIPNAGIDGQGMPLDVINAFGGVDGRAADRGRGLVAWAIDREGGGGRFTVAHEVAHLFDVAHPAAEDAPLTPDLTAVWSTCAGATELQRALTDPFPWIFPKGALGDYSFIGPVENAATGVPDPLDENWGISRLVPDGSGDVTSPPYIVEPTDHFAEMGSCAQYSDPDHGWMSDVSWERALDGLAARVANPSIPQPSTPDTQLRVSGLVDFDAGTLEILDVEPVASDYVPLDYAEGDFILGVFDAAATLLGFIEFEVLVPPIEQDSEPSGGIFDLVIPNDPSIAQVAFAHASDITTILDSRTRSPTAPSVTVVQPNGGELLDAAPYEVQWTAVDADLDPLVYDVQYSDDAGATWIVIATDLTSTALTVDPTTLPGSTQALVRVTARDGFDAGRDTSDAVFEVTGKVPEVELIRPAPATIAYGTQTLVLEGAVLDVEDGELDGADVVWSSSLDGLLGTGRRLSVVADTLTPGPHLLTVTGTDGDGNPSSEQVAITVEAAFPNADLDVDLEADASVRVGETFGQTAIVRNDGPDGSGDVLLTLTTSPVLAFVSAATSDGVCAETEPGRVECALDPLASGAQGQIDVTWQAVGEGETLVLASAEGDVEDPDSANDSDTTEVPEPTTGPLLAAGVLGCLGLSRLRRRRPRSRAV